MSEVKSFRVRKSSIYNKDTSTPFKISRSKFFDFLNCKRCFYLDRVKGLKEPSTPPYTFNNTVDELLKKEFDIFRSKQKPHPIMIKNKLDFVPFEHKDLNTWRNSLKGGISYLDKNTNLILHGGIDDIWFDLKKKELVVVDYKAQSSNYPVAVTSYLDSTWRRSYKLQMDIYVYILRKMKLKVSNLSYFLVCNAEKNINSFNENITFKTYLIPYSTNTLWIESQIIKMKKLLDSDRIPEINLFCEKCAYLKGAKKYF